MIDLFSPEIIENKEDYDLLKSVQNKIKNLEKQLHNYKINKEECIEYAENAMKILYNKRIASNIWYNFINKDKCYNHCKNNYYWELTDCKFTENIFGFIEGKLSFIETRI